MRQKIKAKAVVTIAVALAFLIAGPTATADTNTSQQIAKQPDELDQFQEVIIEGIGLVVGRITIPDVVDQNFQVAQEFIPQKTILTRIELSIAKNATTIYPFTLGIRDELTHPDLVTVNCSVDLIPTENFSWVEFNIPDLWVTIGTPYYIVCRTQNITNNYYGWIANNHSESYPYGCAWLSIDDGQTWSNDSVDLALHNNQQSSPKADENATWDMVFRTYGIDATELTVEYEPGMIQSRFLITNAGSMTGYDVEASCTITGGVLNRINKTFSTTLAELLPAQHLELLIGPVIGFGPIIVHVGIRAANAEEHTIELHGFVFFIFLFISAR